MNSRHVALALLLAFAPIAGSVSPAFAQTPAADDASTKAARARFQEGVAFYDKGQFENARAAFLQAYALRKHPAVLINLAQSSLRSGHTAEAASYFQQYLRESTTLTTAQRADAEKGLADARAKLGRIEVIATAGAEVSLDGEKVGTAPLAEPLDVEPGAHRVSVKLPDGTSDTKSVSALSGQQASVHFGAAGAEAPVTTPTPPTPAPEPPTEPAEKPEAPTPEPAPPPPPPKKDEGGHIRLAPAIVGGVVSVAGFVTAIILASSKAKAQSNANDVKSRIGNAGGGKGACYGTPTAMFAPACKILASDDNNVNVDATIANVGLAVGIVGAVGAVGWLIFGPRTHASSSPQSASISVEPMVGPHVGGLGFSTSF